LMEPCDNWQPPASPIFGDLWGDLFAEVREQARFSCRHGVFYPHVIPWGSEVCDGPDTCPAPLSGAFH